MSVEILASTWPGETLREVLEGLGVSQTWLSDETGYSLKHVNCVLQGRRRISPDFALALEGALGAPRAEFWLYRQANYDMAVLRLAAEDKR